MNEELIQEIKSALNLYYIPPQEIKYYGGYVNKQEAKIELRWDDEVLDTVSLSNHVEVVLG